MGLDITPIHTQMISVQFQQRVESKLRNRFEPIVLEVTNESPMHNVPAGSETHLKVVVVSAAFAGKSAVERHRLVYAALTDEIRDGLHALSVTSRSPEEWEADSQVADSPACRGGSSH
jgi:stress-induced morphogen